MIRARQLADVDGEGLVWGGIGFVASLLVGVGLSPFRGSLGLENVVIVYLAVVTVVPLFGGGLLASLGGRAGRRAGVQVHEERPRRSGCCTRSAWPPPAAREPTGPTGWRRRDCWSCWARARCGWC